VPLRNRVAPSGEIVAVAGRGTLLGNRGILHNQEREIVRDWTVRRWIACRLHFRGRQREVMTPGRWTELFFLDEAVALADGHRPCAECRHADYAAFQDAWHSAYPQLAANAEAMDAVLHAERRRGQWRKRTYDANIDGLPEGTFVELDGRAWLVHQDVLLAWSPAGYRDPRPKPVDRTVVVLTPRSVVGILAAGYQPALHPSSSV
jgi:hypothetical protein